MGWIGRGVPALNTGRQREVVEKVDRGEHEKPRHQYHYRPDRHRYDEADAEQKISRHEQGHDQMNQALMLHVANLPLVKSLELRQWNVSALSRQGGDDEPLVELEVFPHP